MMAKEGFLRGAGIGRGMREPLMPSDFLSARHDINRRLNIVSLASWSTTA